MKVLFNNRAKDAWIGGDFIQLEKTRTALEQIGVETEFHHKLLSPALRMREFDMVHCFNFSMEWTKYHIWQARKWNKPVVCSMIYHESPDFIPYEHQQIMMDELSKAIFLTKGELERARRHLNIPDSKIAFVPNAIDEFWFSGISGSDVPPFVLTVGRIEPFKGQLATAKACKKLGIPYIVIGEPTDPQYAKEVEQEGGVVYPPMGPEQLIKFYAQCKVFVLASRAEVWPLVVMEAGAQAKNVVLTDHCEWEVPGVERCEWNNEDSIEKAIKAALKKGPNFELQTFLRQYTWPKVGKQLLEIYESLCNER